MLLVKVKQMSAWVPVTFFRGECSRTSVEITVPSSRAAALSEIDLVLSSGSQHTRVFHSSRFLQPTFHPGQIGLTVNIWVLLFGVIIVFVGNRVKSRLKTEAYGSGLCWGWPPPVVRPTYASKNIGANF